MPLVAAYHRPTDLTEAMELLSEPHRIPLAGGTLVNSDRVASTLEAVDLQGLHLDTVDHLGDRVVLGAMVRLDSVIGVGDELLVEAARRELPSTLRSLATVGGTVASGDPDSMVLAALLVSECTVTLADGRTNDLETQLEKPGGLIVGVSFRIGGSSVLHHTGRTPMDTPIVAAAGRRLDGRTRVALTGVAEHPRLLASVESIEELQPSGDFRGSSEYRMHLARILTGRVQETLS